MDQQSSEENAETKEGWRCPPSVAEEIHAPQINSKAAFNAPPSGDEGFALCFNETFQIAPIILGDGALLNCHLAGAEADVGPGSTGMAGTALGSTTGMGQAVHSHGVPPGAPPRSHGPQLSSEPSGPKTLKRTAVGEASAAADQEALNESTEAFFTLLLLSL